MDAITAYLGNYSLVQFSNMNDRVGENKIITYFHLLEISD